MMRAMLLSCLCAVFLSAQVSVNLTVQTAASGATVPPQFTGFSYETSSLTSTTFFYPGNLQLLRLITQVGPGVLRYGGNSSDTTAWTRTPRSSSTPANTLTSDDVTRLMGFAQQTGDGMLFSLNLGTSTPAIAADEAAYVASVATVPFQFEIGNEPDLFHSNGLRATTYTFSNYLTEWQSYVAAVRQSDPAAILTGPAASGSITTWTVPFAQQTKGQIVLLTQHYYPLAPLSAVASTASNAATIPNLLSASRDSATISTASQVEVGAVAAGIPWRMAESNSAYNGGQTGVSDVFAAALWGADYMFALASNTASGVNFHGGNSGTYTPIAVTNGQYGARPLYYGMLVFRLGAGESGGQFLPIVRGNDNLNMTAYAVKRPEGSVAVTLVNKDVQLDANVTLVASPYSSGYVWQLTAPAPSSTTGITLGGSAVATGGAWEPTSYRTLNAVAGSFTLTVPAASAAVVILGGTPLAVRDAASGGDQLTAAGIASAYGTGLSAGMTVSVKDSAGQVRQGEIFSASGTQVNFQIPPATAYGLSTVTIGTASGGILITPAAPAIFTADMSGSGLPAGYLTQAAAGGAQSTVPVTSTPVAFPAGASVYLTLYGTGIRGTQVSNMSCAINKTSAPITYAGPQGVFDGLDQVNIQLPASLHGAGVSQLTFTVAGRVSNTVSLSF
jgi:uncharacterized protein (TIGR03437 family)